MDVIYRKKRTGRTSELIARAASTGAYIVCANSERRRNIVALARDLDIKIRHPVTIGEHRQDPTWRGSWVRNIVIDDLDACLQGLFPSLDIEAIVLEDTTESETP